MRSRRWRVAGLVLGALAWSCAPKADQVTVSQSADQRAVHSVGVTAFAWSAPVGQTDPTFSMIHGANAGTAVADQLAAQLLSTGRYVIRERTYLDKVLAEKNLQLAEVVQRGDYPLLGQVGGVDAIVVGTVNAYTVVVRMAYAQVQVSYDCRCVSTRTGEVLWTMGGEKIVRNTLDTDPGIVSRELTAELVGALQKKLSAAGAGSR